jgi:hypothetical protein
MGGFCTTSTTELPTSEKVLSGTELPEWVSAGGRILFDEAMELAKGDYPEYEAPRIASYTDAEGQVTKLTPEEQDAFALLTKGENIYKTYLDNAYTKSQALGKGYEGYDKTTLMGDPYVGATRGELLGTDADLTKYSDVYQRAMDPAVREAEELMQRTLTQKALDAGRTGAFGSRLALMEGEAVGEGAKAVGDLRAQAAREGIEFGASQAERDRAARFAAEDTLRNRFMGERDARFATESALRSAYETEEASRVRQAEDMKSYAPLVQGLTEQAAAGLLTAGEARRSLDQMALDLAYADYVQQKEYPFQMLNFALGALKGVPYEQTQYSLSQGQQFQESPSIYGQTLGGLGSLASAYYMSR